MATIDFRSIRVERHGARVQMVMANRVFGMTLTEALKLSDAVADVAEGRKAFIELWFEGTIEEKVEG